MAIEQILLLYGRLFDIYYKHKIHSSCEIEDFGGTHLCKLCVILRSRVLRVVHIYTSAKPACFARLFFSPFLIGLSQAKVVDGIHGNCCILGGTV